MQIESTVVNQHDEKLAVVYRDIDSAAKLEGRAVSAVHAYCFYGDKLVIVYSYKKGSWTPPGGNVEKGETPEEAVVREVKEEANMKVIKHAFLGLQDIATPAGTITQTRSVCIVEPYGDFATDPDSDITEVRLIYPSEHKHYFDWGTIGDHLLERALKLRASLEK